MYPWGYLGPACEGRHQLNGDPEGSVLVVVVVVVEWNGDFRGGHCVSMKVDFPLLVGP